jgi:protocatechuate 3,4-dioxygenase beta subunit
MMNKLPERLLNCRPRLSNLTIWAVMGALLATPAHAMPADPWKVVDEAQHPIAGASVDYYRTRSGGRFDLPIHPEGLLERTVTDAKGEFRLASAAGAALIVVQKSGFGPAWVNWEDGADDPPKPIVLFPRSPLEGKVVDEDHHPVANAEVWASEAMVAYPGNSLPKNLIRGQAARDCFLVHTTADGKFRIENFPYGSLAVLTASRPGYVQLSQKWYWAIKSGDSNIELMIGPAATVEGKVLDRTSGLPVPGVIVKLGDAISSSPSAADGSFHVTEVKPGPNHASLAMRDQQTAGWVDVFTNVPIPTSAGKVTDGVLLYAARSVPVEVTVESANDGKPMANVSVGSTRDISGVTDSNGFVQLAVLPEEKETTIWAAKRGWRTQMASFKAETEKTNFVKIEMIPPPVLSGTVRDASGASAAGVVVSFHPGSFPGAPYYSETKTDAKGHYQLTLRLDSPSGGSWINPYHTGFVLARDLNRNLAAYETFEDIPNHLDLSLQPGISITGTVKDPQGAPVPTAQVILRFQLVQPFDLVEPQAILADSQGAFLFAALPQGLEYELNWVTAPGYGDYASPPLRPEATHTRRYEFTNIVLTPAKLQKSGIVKEPEGERWR